MLPPGLEKGVEYPLGSLELRFLRFDAPEDAVRERAELAHLEGLGVLPCHHVAIVMPLQPGSSLLCPSTPLMDKLLAHQRWDDGVVNVFYALIGRLRFPLGYLDRWQVMPFLGRTSGTGKSTIIGLFVDALFRYDTVFALPSGASLDPIALGNLFRHDVISAPELGQTSCPRLQDFNSMVSSDNVAVKLGRDDLSIKFDTPMIWASNTVLHFKRGLTSPDNFDAAARRIVMFPFNVKLTPELQADANEDRIRACELPGLAARSLTAYISLVKKLRPGSSSDTFWGSVPAQLRNLRLSHAAFRQTGAGGSRQEVAALDDASKYFEFTGAPLNLVGMARACVSWSFLPVSCLIC